MEPNENTTLEPVTVGVETPAEEETWINLEILAQAREDAAGFSLDELNRQGFSNYRDAVINLAINYKMFIENRYAFPGTQAIN